MITVKKIEAPSVKILDKEPIKPGKQNKQLKAIKFVLPKISEKRILETATYSTIIVVDGKYISLSVTKHLGYQKPYNLNHKLPTPKGVDLFEDTFYWPIESFKNQLSLIYKMILESNYHYQSGLIYELNWEVIDLRMDNKSFTISNKERSYTGVVPSNNSETTRYDYILDNGHYKYDCKPGQYTGRAIEIIVTKK